LDKTTHTAEVVKVHLEKHPNADSLSIVQVDGYTVVVRTSDWVEDELGVYIKSDSVVKTTRPEFSFLKTEGRDIERIKVKKLRGIISMGLLIKSPINSKLGDDVASILEVEHYEPPMEMSTYGENIRGPSLLYSPPKYDVDSIRSYPDIFQEGELISITEKVHGCLQEDTLISLENNIKKKIKDIVIGDAVISHNGTSINKSIVTNTFCNKDINIDWYKLEFENGKHIICTFNHPILTTVGYVPACELNESHEILEYN
jgi:RNA ligase (TIGR02306 family)